MKDEFVMVPRDWAERVISAGRGEPVCQSDVELLSAAVKAEQHQGEPVAMPAKRTNFDYKQLGDDGYVAAKEWNARLDEIAKLGPLYTRPAHGEPVSWVADVVMHNGEKIIDGNMAFMTTAEIGTKLYTRADPAEVERLRKENERLRLNISEMNDEARIRDAQLAERDALLQKTAAAVREYAGDYSSDHAEHWQLHGLADEAQALSASAEPRAEVKKMRLLVKREGVGVYRIEQSNPAKFAGHSFNKLVVPTGFRVRFETGEIHVSKCADREQVERDERADFDTWFNEQKLCKGSTYLNNFKLERGGEFVSIPELMFEAFQLGAKQGVKS